MDWDKIRIFYTVAEAGSFTRAGDDLGLSQSAVSRQISALERELKAPLFHRHARGLILTEQGDLLFRAARDMRMRLETTKARLVETSERPSGELKVTTTVGLGSIWLAQRIARVPRPLPGCPRRADPHQRGARPRHARGRRGDPPAPPGPARPDPAPPLHGAFPRLRLERLPQAVRRAQDPGGSRQAPHRLLRRRPALLPHGRALALDRRARGAASRASTITWSTTSRP